MPASLFRRYAIYYTPPAGPFAQFGAEWLGWNIVAARRPARRLEIPGLPAPIGMLTEAPRRYGFHATIKPPFRLSPAKTEADLAAALTAFCAARPVVTITDIDLARLGRFVALVPSSDTSAINTLASETVRSFDSFRAAPTAEELAKYNNTPLNAAQAENLRLWGYPHVMDSFRWHMTLTGKFSRAEAEETRAALAPVLAPLLPRPLYIDALSLVGEDPSGQFHLIHRKPLAG